MPSASSSPAYTSSFVHALQFASHIHAYQRRKGGNAPYIAHLMAFSASVWDFGGTEAEAIGALLHDAAEDCGGRGMLEKVRTSFGEDVALIVEG
jgi:(p)ppGpp synthase/HD superfamily hydrolase